MPVMAMQHYADPAEEIIDRIGDLSDVVVPGNKVLLGIYMRPSQTKSGLHLPDKYREEDLYQGKAALVLKCGPAAFKGDWRTEGFDPKPGDWVAFRPSDGFKIDIRSPEGHCILLVDTAVRLIIPAPHLVF
jgi:hypothetical protein